MNATPVRFRALGADFRGLVSYTDLGPEFEADIRAVTVTQVDGVAVVPGFQLEFAELPERAQDAIFRAISAPDADLTPAGRSSLRQDGAGAAGHATCDDPGCPEHGIAADNRRQSEFYAKHDRTKEAQP